MTKLLVIFAHWCPICNMVVPVVEEIENNNKEKMQVTWLDIDLYPNLYEDYSIQLIPTIIIMRDDKEVARMSGMLGEETLKERILFE